MQHDRRSQFGRTALVVVASAVVAVIVAVPARAMAGTNTKKTVRAAAQPPKLSAPLRASLLQPDVVPVAKAKVQAPPADDDGDGDGDDDSPAAGETGAIAQRAGAGSQLPTSTGSLATASLTGASASSEVDADRESDSGTTDNALALEAEVDVNARYVWRGIALSRGGVAQPSASASYAGFTADVWASFDLAPERGTLTTVAPSLSYERDIGKLRLSPSLDGYVLPASSAWTTGEVGLEVSYPLGPIRVANHNHLDVVRHPGAYFGTLGLEAKHRLSRSFTLRGYADVGVGTTRFNEVYLETRTTAVNVVEAGVALKYSITTALYVVGHVEASTLVASSLRDFANSANSVGGPTLGNVGLTLGVER